MPKFIDFPTIYGKLGNHPSLLTGDQALALFQQGMKCPPGANIIEYWPDGGRSTVILAAVARNLGGRLYVYTNWIGAPPNAQHWFQQAWKTHGLEQVTELDSEAYPSQPALIVVRGAHRPPLSGRLLVLGDVGQANGHAPSERGPGWYVVADYVAEARPAVAVLADTASAN